MEVRKPAKFLLIIAILFYLLSAVMLYKGYDKMTNYSNPEYSFMTTHNAYVGGDAYNYIINGNYATGFFRSFRLISNHRHALLRLLPLQRPVPVR